MTEQITFITDHYTLLDEVKETLFILKQIPNGKDETTRNSRNEYIEAAYVFYQKMKQSPDLMPSNISLENIAKHIVNAYDLSSREDVETLLKYRDSYVFDVPNIKSFTISCKEGEEPSYFLALKEIPGQPKNRFFTLINWVSFYNNYSNNSLKLQFEAERLLNNLSHNYSIHALTNEQKELILYLKELAEKNIF